MGIVERSVETRAGKLHVSDSQGSGFPLVMLHGSGASGKVFERQFQGPLAEAARLIAIDLPGHGRSENAGEPSSAYTLPALAAAIGDAVRQLDLDSPAILGWSLGGHVAIEMLAGGQPLGGLLLTGASPVPRGLLGMLRGFHPSFDLLLASKPVFSPRDVGRFLKLCYGEDATPEFREAIERADGRLRAVFSQSMMRGEGADQRQAVLGADVPVHLVNGADDPFIRLSYIAGFENDRDPRTAVETIADAGHAAFWQQAAAFDAFVLRFMDAAASHARHAASPRKVSA